MLQLRWGGCRVCSGIRRAGSAHIHYGLRASRTALIITVEVQIRATAVAAVPVRLTEKRTGNNAVTVNCGGGGPPRAIVPRKAASSASCIELRIDVRCCTHAIAEHPRGSQVGNYSLRRHNKTDKKKLQQ